MIGLWLMKMKKVWLIRVLVLYWKNDFKINFMFYDFKYTEASI